MTNLLLHLIIHLLLFLDGHALFFLSDIVTRSQPFTILSHNSLFFPATLHSCRAYARNVRLRFLYRQYTKFLYFDLNHIYECFFTHFSFSFRSEQKNGTCPWCQISVNLLATTKNILLYIQSTVPQGQFCSKILLSFQQLGFNVYLSGSRYIERN